MINEVTITGRITKDPEVKELSSGKRVSNITVAVPRSYKNENGEYDTDFFDCELWGGVADSTCENCKKGDSVGIKGRLQNNSYETESGEKRTTTRIIANRVIFIASAKNKNKEDEIEM